MNVPKVKKTYPLTKSVRSNASFCMTFTRPNVADASNTVGKTSFRFNLSEQNITNTPRTSRINPGALP